MYKNNHFRNSLISQRNHCLGNGQGERTSVTAPTCDNDSHLKQTLEAKRPLSPQGKVWVLAASKWLCSFLSSLSNSTTQKRAAKLELHLQQAVLNVLCWASLSLVPQCHLLQLHSPP